MAFSVTQKPTLPLVLNGNGQGIIPLKVVDLDNILRSLLGAPTDGSMIAVVGAILSEGSGAQNVSFASGTDEEVIVEVAANSILQERIGKPIFICQPNQALQMKSSTTISSALIYVQYLQPHSDLDHTR